MERELNTKQFSALDRLMKSSPFATVIGWEFGEGPIIKYSVGRFRTIRKTGYPKKVDWNNSDVDLSQISLATG